MSFRRDTKRLIDDAFRTRLLETKVKDLSPRWSAVINCKSTETISDVFGRLIQHKIFAVPLLDVTTNKYTAFIDLFDILTYVVDVLNLPLEANDDWIVSQQFRNTSCLTLVGRSPRSNWNLIGEEATLQQAINALQGVHRLAVVDAQGNLRSILSQSRVIRWLACRSDYVMGDIATATVEDTRLGFCDLVTINKNEKALNAFLKMNAYNLSGIAVVDNTDTVIGNISVSDLKDIGYAANMFKRLTVPSGNFLNRKIEGANLPKLVSANRSTTVKEVLDMYKNNEIHRVYVVTAEFHRPLGVITLTDMLSLFSSAA